MIYTQRERERENERSKMTSRLRRARSFSDFHALPEGCVANALSLTSPKDACRLSAVANLFRSAAESDSVWERFLPPDYRDIVSRSDDGLDSFLSKFRSKKQLYLHLCNFPILIDNGTKSFSLEIKSGKKCFMLAARDLFIVWSGSPQYWQWTSTFESRFDEVADLLNVCWFEIRGKINAGMLSSDTKYSAYLVYKIHSLFRGFDYEPAEGLVGIIGHDNEKTTVCLDPKGYGFLDLPFTHRTPPGYRYRPSNIPMDENAEYPKRKGDGWMEVKLGEVWVEGKEDGDMEISLMEVKSGKWKRGITIEGIEIRPSAV